jgi:TatD DNase family protein
MIFETHAHYDDSRFDEDRDAVLGQMQQAGIGPIVNVGASIESTKTTLELAEKYDFVYAAVGVHPSEIADLNKDTFEWLRNQTSKEKVVAVGEIGLDYYWDKELEVQESQRYWFGQQLELAREANLPVIIHSRDAGADTLKVMKEHHAEEIPGVIHCYSYSKELALEFIKMGYYIGIGGVVTFKNARKLVETHRLLSTLQTIILATQVECFEQAIYLNNYEGPGSDKIMADGKITADEYDAVYAGISEYLGIAESYRADEYWRYVTISSPCYYISYAISGVNALQIYVNAMQEGFEDAKESYLKLFTYTDVDPEMTTEEILLYAGLTSYVDEQTFVLIKSSLSA